MNDIPTGFLMSLAQDEQAMRRFSSLSSSAQEQITAQAKQANSHEEMHSIINSLSEQEWTNG